MELQLASYIHEHSDLSSKMIRSDICFVAAVSGRIFRDLIQFHGNDDLHVDGYFQFLKDMLFTITARTAVGFEQCRASGAYVREVLIWHLWGQLGEGRVA
jgi:hypothetical protein